MRKIVILLLLFSTILAACTAGGQTGAEPAVESGSEEVDVPALTLITPDSGEEYPAAESGYPAAPDTTAMPTGYPELAVVAPSGEVDLSDLTPVTPNSGLQVMPAPGRPNRTPTPQLSLVIEAVARDLNAVADVPIDEIKFISAEPVVWPNGALGCPADGMAYVEVQVDGMLITLEAAGQAYTYHTDGGQNFVLCQDGKPVSSGVLPQSR